MRFIATFGQASKYSERYVVVHADSETQAIHKMTDRYGSAWSMLYATEDGAGVTRYGLTLLEELK